MKLKFELLPLVLMSIGAGCSTLGTGNETAQTIRKPAQIASTQESLIAKCTVHAWNNSLSSPTLMYQTLCLNDSHETPIPTVNGSGISGSVKAVNSKATPESVSIMVLLNDSQSGAQSIATSHYYYDTYPADQRDSVSGLLKGSSGVQVEAVCQPLIPKDGAQSGVDPLGQCPASTSPSQ